MGCAGFNSKHEKRDLKLPKGRKQIKEEIERDLLHDRNVTGLFYGGSIGTGSTDLYSDIDLRIVVKSEVFELYRSNKKNRAHNWGEVIFYEDSPVSSHSVAHFKEFIKVDSFYYTQKDLKPSVWLKEIEIIHDEDHFLHELQRKSNELQYASSIDEFEIWRSKFFAHSHEVYRGMKRGEFLYAMSSIDSLRFILTSGWFMESGKQPNNPGYWAKLGGSRSRLEAWQEVFLEKTHCSPEEESIRKSLCILIEEFKRIHHVLCKKFGIEENKEQIAAIFNLIL
ncbi:hypothetical protein D3H55_09365 [Bacillus salacetis]|uniref:Nucleotidyltransferase domain-containing protein n=1 Tax=Bacillus salacetis TaxID=2315464 RepID=A0A3A1R4C7_9BACI|nr:aminoglycoside 6-adenylyltransferase [Bacillus salacetis]RIW34711.1 hypothetical protein D3H55_09365 [Bacillus salacetis]